MRLKTHAYRKGSYFVTICTAGREPVFGRVDQGRVFLSAEGCVARACWLAIEEHFPFVRLDAFVVMPDHMHGIVHIDDPAGRGVTCHAPTSRGFRLPPKSLCSVIHAYKSSVTRDINRMRSESGAKIWQKGYHDRIIRDKRAYEDIRRYIIDNPGKASSATKQKDHRSGL